jgi:hypothetical protein
MSKPLPLRPVRESAKGKLPVIPVSTIAWLISDGTAGCTGDHVAPDRETARRVWPQYRRKVWAATCRGNLSAAAQCHDDLTTLGFEYVHSHWQDEVFNLNAALAAVEADRAAVRRFEQRDPRGAREIRDYLAMFVEHLDRVADEARRLALSSAPTWRRGYPSSIIGGLRYGDDNAPRRNRQALEAAE